MTVTVSTWEDRDSWNDFVAATPRPHFQQTWEWGELAPSLGGQAVRLAALRGTEIAGAMQLFANPIRGINRSYLYVPRGPAVFEPSIDVLGPLFHRAALEGARWDSIGIRVEPDATACDERWKRSLSALAFHPTYPPSQPRSSWVLDIDTGEDELLAGMKSKTRYNIRLAAKKGVDVMEGGPQDIGEFYALLQETAVRDDFFIHPESLYRRMFSLFWDAGVFALRLARFEGRLIAAITLVRCGPVCWYLHGASSNAHRNLMATYLLQWEGIRWAQQQGCTLYDFRAVPDVLEEGQDMYGVYRFKEGFGGRHVTTLHSYSAPYQAGLFGLWQIYYRARFDLDARRRQRRGLPRRQFA